MLRGLDSAREGLGNKEWFETSTKFKLLGGRTLSELSGG